MQPEAYDALVVDQRLGGVGLLPVNSLPARDQLMVLGLASFLAVINFAAPLMWVVWPLCHITAL